MINAFSNSPLYVGPGLISAVDFWNPQPLGQRLLLWTRRAPGCSAPHGCTPGFRGPVWTACPRQFLLEPALDGFALHLNLHLTYHRGLSYAPGFNVFFLATLKVSSEGQRYQETPFISLPISSSRIRACALTSWKRHSFSSRSSSFSVHPTT